MRADAVTRDRTVRDEVQLDVDDVVGQPSPVEEPARLADREGQDVRQEDVRDRARGPGAVAAEMLERVDDVRPELASAGRPLGRRVRLVEVVLVGAGRIEDRVDRGPANL